ncbi:MAG: hypothetical protein AVDCRST_MAG49-4133 [uncultured Thermomicrobiales bacterium]|uniref:Cytochrome c domain-containing protein n=1 Tax=uncultured Thermomicrobiales bacterium TaxID=1645740 RepID=A0A6J4VD76_9BACT|nr:MAG: hypothetical protein AVDCRST_MAG49-4133 [uncultured Thermomicrobiales bacterium]
MQAVQKLALVVILGLTALATLLVIYLADEPNRREVEAEEQQEASIERGIETYVANCLTCHGPAGEGAAAGDGRIGAAIGGNTEATELNQSEDPAVRAQRAELISYTLHNGRPAQCALEGPPECIMPAFAEAQGGTLNEEQINELVIMIQNVDWNHVYNDVVAENGGAYPTAPPTAAPESGTDAPSPPTDGPTSAELSAPGIAWSTNQLSAGVGGTIHITNDGSGGFHNFVVRDPNSHEELTPLMDLPVGADVNYTLPPDLAPGTYEFVCTVPGHTPTMTGTLTVTEAPAAAPAAAAQPGAPAAGGAPPPAGGAAPVEMTMPGIAWSTPEFSIPMGGTIHFVNDGSGGNHNFVIEGYNGDQPVIDLPAGFEGDYQLPADLPAGTYTFLCNVPGHPPTMTGTMTVQ